MTFLVDRRLLLTICLWIDFSGIGDYKEPREQCNEWSHAFFPTSQHGKEARTVTTKKKRHGKECGEEGGRRRKPRNLSRDKWSSLTKSKWAPSGDSVVALSVCVLRPFVNHSAPIQIRIVGGVRISALSPTCFSHFL